MYLLKRINWLDGLYYIFGLMMLGSMGLFLSSSFSVSIKIGFILLLFLFLYFATNPLLTVLMLLFIRPVIDMFATVRFGENVNLLGLFSALYIMFAILLFFRYRLSNSQRFEIAPSGIRFYYVVLFFSALSILVSANAVESMMYLIRFTSLLAIYFLVYNLIQVEDDALKIVKSIVYSSFVPILMGFYQYITGKGKFDVEFGTLRIWSTFMHPNMFAFYLVVVFFSVLFLYYLEKHIFGKSDVRFKIVLLMPVLSLLLLTYTRGAWIGIMVGILIVSVFIKSTRKWILISAVVFFILFSPMIYSRMGDLLVASHKGGYQHMSSWEFRIEQWHSLLKNAFVHKPWFGYGLGQSIFVANKYAAFVLIPHNDYLRIMIELGLFGLIPFLLFWIHNVRNIFKRISNKAYRELNTVVLALLIAMLICSFADNLIYSISVIGYLFALLAVMHKMNFIASANTPKDSVIAL
ncbi:MAG: hypothetical protein HW406_9 [Candidatus Brocadiaceae bacterium]|nr:hypothetical protein [Candidatus Brocadiaceae bacterium]